MGADLVGWLLKGLVDGWALNEKGRLEGVNGGEYVWRAWSMPQTLGEGGAGVRLGSQAARTWRLGYMPFFAGCATLYPTLRV